MKVIAATWHFGGTSTVAIHQMRTLICLATAAGHNLSMRCWKTCTCQAFGVVEIGWLGLSMLSRDCQSWARTPSKENVISWPIVKFAKPYVIYHCHPSKCKFFHASNPIVASDRLSGWFSWNTLDSVSLKSLLFLSWDVLDEMHRS